MLRLFNTSLSLKRFSRPQCGNFAKGGTPTLPRPDYTQYPGKPRLPPYQDNANPSGTALQTALTQAQAPLCSKTFRNVLKPHQFEILGFFPAQEPDNDGGPAAGKYLKKRGSFRKKKFVHLKNPVSNNQGQKVRLPEEKRLTLKKLVLVFLVAIAFVVSGCTLGTTSISYVASASPEKLCTLRIAPTLTVTQFNDETVKWSGDFASWGEVQIPEGTHSFVLTYNAAHGYQSNIHFTASFAAGRTYSMIAQPISQTTVRISVADGAL